MSDGDLSVLDDYVSGLLAKLSDAERRKVARAIATDLRRSQATRIAAQVNPDGSAFAPRKRPPLRSSAGRVKRAAAMFPKLRKASFLGIEATPDAASVGFMNSTVARVARVHQEGLRDRVTRKPDAPVVRYPARQLLGVTPDDRDNILARVLAHLEA